MMEQDSTSAFKIPQQLTDYQNYFFIQFIHQQDEDVYYIHTSSENNANQPNYFALDNKIKQVSKPKNNYLNQSFTNHQLLIPKQNTPIEFNRTNLPYNWISISILICLILISLSRVLYNRRFGQVLKAIFINRAFSQINRESNLIKEGITVLLLIIFFISTSLFLFKSTIIYFNFDLLGLKPNISYFFLILLIVFAYYLLKLMLIKFIAYVFNTQQETNDYILYNLIFLFVTGIFLIFPIIIQSYISNIIGFYIAFFMLIISETYRISKAVFTLFSYSKFSIIFIFLYLCTVEIIPVMIAYKIIENYVIT